MDKRPIDQKLQSLVGTRIARSLSGDGGLFLSNGFTLAIYCPVRLYSNGAIELDPSQVAGRRLESVVCSAVKVLIEIEGRIRLEIDLDERNMTGPEHLELRSEKVEITVWRWAVDQRIFPSVVQASPLPWKHLTPRDDWRSHTVPFMGIARVDIRIGPIGKIAAGDDAGKYVKVVDDSANTGGFLILVGSDRDMSDGHDYWVEDRATLDRFFQESKWGVEWN